MKTICFVTVPFLLGIIIGRTVIDLGGGLIHILILGAPIMVSFGWFWGDLWERFTNE